MNSFIETLNQWGVNFLSYAWPMLWQSSLLIAALLVFDFLFRRKLRASIRYALWLVVLVKLCVPPTLALPTSPAWWLHQTPPPVAAKPKPPHYTLTYDQGPLMEMPSMPLAEYTPPPPAMTTAAWLLAIFLSVGAALLLWMLVRWWQITRLVRRAATSGRLTTLADEVRRSVGMKNRVLVKLTARTMSPAVCGLFRPTILIPKTLAENFSDDQLRAVLLHELIHLRRCDVWLNFLQTLLQIGYWWHPLVWLANARIRRVREEAVDDAVMLALQDEAETYAPTLLQVAKLALNRPLATLGLVGILESRSALRQRIERLVDFQPPRKAGLTLVSLLGILTFTAVAVPMGEAPAVKRSENGVQVLDEPTNAVMASGRGENKIVLPAISAPISVLQNTNPPQVLIQAEFYRMRLEDFQKIASAAKAGEENPDKIKNFKQLVQGLKTSGIEPFQRPRVLTTSDMPASLYIGDATNHIQFDCQPFVTNGLVDLVRSVQVVSSSENVTTTNQFSDRISIENHGGRVVCMKSQEDAAGNNEIVIAFSVEILTNAPSQFQQRLQTIVKRTDGTNSPTSGNETNLLFSRVFAVDPHTFIASLKKAGVDLGGSTNSAEQIVPALRDFFASLGVDMKSPPGKSLFYKDTTGRLFVRATQDDLDTIERALEVLNSVPPQIHIKAWFLEVPKGTVAGFGNFLNTTNSATNLFTGILNETNAKLVLHSLESLNDVETLAEPEVTTTSGRQTQMRATQVVTVVTNFAFQESLANGTGSIFPQTRAVEIGPILDVVPYVLADGYTINLTIIPSLTEFLGYDKPPDVPNVTGTNNRVQLPMVLPNFRTRQMVATLNLWDGQTAMIGGLPKATYMSGNAVAGNVKVSDKELLVFITATIVDPAGNRVHKDEEITNAHSGAPPQPMQTK